MAEIAWPSGTAPGVHSGEAGGRLINVYAEKAAEGSRSQLRWPRAPGLRLRFTTPETEARGAIDVGGVLYVVSGDKAYSVIKSGSSYNVTELTGTVGGSGPVFIARNMKSPIPDVLIVHSAGMSSIDISGSSVSSFSDGDLPSIIDITWLDGYFFVISGAGKVFASAINDTTFSSVDNATAEAQPDGLYRCVPIARDLGLFGLSTVEIWTNTGNPTGFPFTRGTVIPVGLKGPNAIAGFEPGFSASVGFVANDNTVRLLEGYAPRRISGDQPLLERLIEAEADATSIECSVYVSAGHACLVVQGSSWAFVYDLTTGRWHERRSYGDTRWRAHFGINVFDEWLTFDRDSGKVFKVDQTYPSEDDQRLVAEMWSNIAHRFPGRFFVKRASFDFLTGVGLSTGIEPIQTAPVVRISWSDDGGRSWSNALTRDLGGEGNLTQIDIFRAGLTGRNGRMWRWEVSDPVDVSFHGGAMDLEGRSA